MENPSAPYILLYHVKTFPWARRMCMMPLSQSQSIRTDCVSCNIVGSLIFFNVAVGISTLQ